MKKIMSLSLILMMVTNGAFANAPTSVDHSKMIEKTFNEFRYKMTVEVDPNNKNYQTEAMEVFKDRVRVLQDQGVSAEEIMNYMRSSTLDVATRADYDRLVASIDPNSISSEEAANIAMKFMASKYQQGANYSGGSNARYKWAYVVIGVVIVGVVTYFLIKHYQNKNDCKDRTLTQTKTETETVTSSNTNTNTNTDTDTGLCCNTNTGQIVSASPIGCENGEALQIVNSPEECAAFSTLGTIQ